MNKKTIKPIVLSALTALAFGAVGTAGTFALFTDKAETTISVEAGKIDVNTEAHISKVFEYDGSANGLEVVASATDDYTNSIGGKTKKGNDGVFALSNWAPGDRAQISVSATNGSTVKAKVRLKAVMTGLLADALVLKITDANFESVQLAAQGARTLVTDWVDMEVGNGPGNFGIEISFPNIGTEITAREEGENNKHQNQSANVVVTYEVVQANANVATSLIERANSILATESVLHGANQSMHEALGDLATLKADLLASPYVYGWETDQFYETTDVAAGTEYKYFKAMSADDASGYSIYAKDNWATSAVPLVGRGFDAGDATGIATVNYTGAVSAHTNYIRTNSLDTALTVTAPQDVIYHYGEAGSANIVSANTQSYHEYGTVPFLEVAHGRVALEEGAKVEKMHFNYDATNEKFDEIIVAYDQSVALPEFSRDPVATIGDGKLVVELQNSTQTKEAQSDYVWLFQQGLKEQIRVSDSKVEAGDVKSTDEGVDQKTAKAAAEIANNLQVGQTATAEEIATGTVDAAKIEEGGMTADEKQEIKKTVVETAIEEKFKEEDMSQYVCRIGAQGFESLQEAADSVATDGIAKTIIVLADNGGTLCVADGKNIVLDLNGHNLTYTGWTLYANGTIYGSVPAQDNKKLIGDILVSSAASLRIIGNGNVRNTRDVGASYPIISSAGSLTIEGGNYSYTGASILGNVLVTQKGSATVLNGGTFSSNARNHTLSVGSGLVAPEEPYPTLVVNKGAEITSSSNCAINIYGHVTINGGRIVGGSTDASTGTTTLNQHVGVGTVTINGGTVLAGQGAYCKIIAQATGTNIYNGGTFNLDPRELDPNRTRAEYDAHVQINGEVVDNGNGTWNVVQPDYIINSDNEVYVNGVKQDYGYSHLFGLVENSPLAGIAEAGDIIFFKNGNYNLGGHYFTQDGVILIGESRDGVVVTGHYGDNVFTSEGDLAIKCMTLEAVAGSSYCVTPDYKNTPCSKALPEWDSDYLFQNVVFSNSKGGALGANERAWGVNVPGKGNADFENCTFSNISCAICGVRDLNGSKTTIKNCTFTNVKEAIGYVAADVLPATVTEWMSNNDGLLAYDNRYGSCNGDEYATDFLKNKKADYISVYPNFVTAY